MNALPIDEKVFKKQIQSFGPHSLGIGILLVILGSVGIVLPGLMSIATLGFVSGVLIVGGALWAYHTYKNNPGSFIDWLKPLLLILSGALMFLFPLPGVASLALLLTVYLILDGYGSFSLAHSRYPEKGWGWMAFNGVADVALAVLFTVGWPKTSLLLVGIFVGVSLVFDGWALIVIGWALRKGGQGGQGAKGGEGHGD